jgi:polyisoprenoid-binding protein YceI
MKNKHRSTIILMALITITSVLLYSSSYAAETYKVDTAHTYILFRVKHLGIGYSYGCIIHPTGTFAFDDSSATNGTIEMQVQANNIFTGVEKRDSHLKSPDFFNAEKHPLISFKSTSFKKISENTYEISGDLTLIEKTRPITIKAYQTGLGKDPYGKYRRGFETSFTIKRSEFGMDFMLSGISDEVNLTVSIEGIRQ